ncbi:ABC transporter ATP-binding protein [Dethiothermospora halolimnae]|uniref:ABC transporter ATP-binding protein n=1 Tax=Dethiothermospora halolimnae TaxID=3114390 RepID=UPI003CCB9A80
MVLETKGLIKVYGGKNESNTTNALNGVNIKVKRGEFVGVMGPSGSGKTTLLNILGGIDKATSGEVKINGKNIDDLNKNSLALFRRENIGYIFQDFNLLDSLTVKENVMLPMILDGNRSSKMENKSKVIMEFFDIYDIGDKYPYNISGGQQQRTAICRALINDPVIVLADEPTGNLDSKSSNNVMDNLKRMNEGRGSTILMVTHDAFAASFCHRVIFIKDGKIHMEIMKKKNRKEFFDRILDCLAVMGGDRR